VHQGLAKSLDISIGMPMIFANLAASRSWHISSQKIAQLRLKAMEDEMNQAARELAFEKAAELRDQIKALKKIMLY